MAEHPILFSGALVRAILRGRKTQTRRAVRLADGAGQPGAIAHLHGREWAATWGHVPQSPTDHGGVPWVHRELIRCPYGEPGDLLWVRETWARVPAAAFRCSREDDGSMVPHRVSPDGRWWALYRAGWTRVKPADCWRPSIHMPRWASRLTLRVTEVRVERLQDISEDDAEAEGVDPYEYPSGPLAPSHRGAFFELWDKLNAQRAPWRSNPWVWVVSFERVTLKPALRPGYGCPGCGWSDHMCDCPERFLRRRS